MTRRRRLPLTALGLLAALGAFGWGLFHLFELRFAGGDVFPAYSTLRRDPLGTAVFHDALAALPGLSVERNLRPLASLGQSTRPGFGPSATDPGAVRPGPLACFYLGADAYQWPGLFHPPEYERLDAILHQGGRVILTFLPGETPLTEKRLERFRHEQAGDDLATPGASPTPTAKTRVKHPPPDAQRWEDLVARWGIDFRRGDLVKTPPAGSQAQPVAGRGLDGAGGVSWHSALDFDLATPGARAAGWQALYQREGRPVVVARPVGGQGGELILASDSYFLSNEALRAEGRPALLAALVGPARRVVFDETHLGIAEQPGMMTLARRYRLQGALASLGLLAGLFIWRNVGSLVPPAPTDGAVTAVTGRDAAAGFLNLLRRGVPPRELIAVCFKQWEHAPGPRPPDGATVGRLRVLAAEGRSPAAAYRAMCAALRKL